MLILLSPAKNQDFSQSAPTAQTSSITFKTEVDTLVQLLKTYRLAELSKLMSISSKLSELNYQRYQDFKLFAHPVKDKTKQALWAFSGDVYKSLDAASFDDADIAFAQDHLVLLSGLYGLLRPLDLIHPYRLEMKTVLKNPQGKDLYQFWGTKLTNQLNQWVSKQANKTIINLASSEYAKAIQPKEIKGNFINIDFKENKGGQLKTIGLMAKRARGLMARYIIKHQITDPSLLKNFGEAGYQYDQSLSDQHKMVFCR